MNIVVINGSPKGPNSISLQTILYLEKLHPEHTFEILHVGQKIRSLEKETETSGNCSLPIFQQLKQADLIIFSYPVYTFIAPYQLHRFIELLKASGISLKEKYVTQFTTSKHFYDVTAHRYIQDNCQDMEMNYIRGLSADMDDLLSAKGQEEARKFFDYVCWCKKKGIHEPRNIHNSTPKHLPVSLPAPEQKEKKGDVVIITDCEPENIQLQNMISRFQTVLPLNTRIVNIREYAFKGGCLGCFNCAVSGKCIYKDNFDDFLRSKIQTAQSIVYAFSIKDHSMGSRFKLYDDRQFCNGHRTVTMGMPVGYLVSGNLSEEANLRMIMEARAQVGTNFLAGIATDETDPDLAIDQLAASLCYALKNKYVPPQNFYGIGGMKVFRDLIWIMQGMMKADHKFYKSHGQYDFPQKQWKTMLKMYLVGALISSPKIKSKMGSAMTDGMLMPYRKVLKTLDNKSTSK